MKPDRWFNSNKSIANFACANHKLNDVVIFLSIQLLTAMVFNVLILCFISVVT